jgi:hypothetical protein
MQYKSSLEIAKSRVAKRYDYESFVSLVITHQNHLPTLLKLIDEVIEVASEDNKSLLKRISDYDYNHLIKHRVSALTADLSDEIIKAIKN